MSVFEKGNEICENKKPLAILQRAYSFLFSDFKVLKDQSSRNVLRL